MDKNINRIGNIILRAITVLLVGMFLFLTVINAIGTTHISYDYNRFCEYAYFSVDNILVTLLIIVAIFAGVYLIDRVFHLDKMNTRKIQVIATIYIIVIGVIWVLAMNTRPVNDQGIVVSCAKAISEGDYSSFAISEYLGRFTHQLGITRIFQIFYEIFGNKMEVAIMITNVLCIAGIFNILSSFLHSITDKIKTHNIYWLMVFACFPPVFYCVFVYGTIIGLFFALLGALGLLKFYQTNKWRFFVMAFFSMSISAISKSNYKIYIIAAVLVLLFVAIKESKYIYILLSLIIALTAFSPTLVQKYYEAESNMKLGRGTPNSLYIAMGLQDGDSENSCGANGWYNAYNVKTFKRENNDYDKSNVVAKKYISGRLSEFMSNPVKAYQFFSEKITTQWSEPTFQTFWMAKAINNHDTPPKWIDNLSEGSFSNPLYQFMKVYMLLVWLGSLVFFIFNFKKLNIWQMYLGVIVLGGFAFSIMWEAKALYNMPFFLMSLVFGASGIAIIYEKLCKLIDNVTKQEQIIENKKQKQGLDK